MKDKHTPHWQRILADQLIHLVIDEDLPAEPVAESLHDAGIATHLTLDQLTTLVAGAAEDAVTRDRLRADCELAYDFVPDDATIRACDLYLVADDIAARYDTSYEEQVARILGAGWALQVAS